MRPVKFIRVLSTTIGDDHYRVTWNKYRQNEFTLRRGTGGEKGWAANLTNEEGDETVYRWFRTLEAAKEHFRGMIVE